MRHLHDLKVPYPAQTPRWYAAYQTRNGARHLLIVPVITLDPSRLAIPTNYRYNTTMQEDWRRAITSQGRDLAVPSWVFPEAANRLCNRQQAVTTWRWSEQPSALLDARPHSYCQTCWNAFAGTPLGHAMTPLRMAQASGSLEMTTEAWRSATEARLHVRR